MLRSCSREGAPCVWYEVSFALNEPAVVELVFAKHVSGYEIGHKCVIDTRDHRGRHRTGSPCARTINEGSLSESGKTGKDSVWFDGHISRSHGLGSGDYTLEIKASNSAGHSETHSLSFTIL